MCGIAGIISNNKDHIAYIKLMTDALDHRGPDASNSFVDSSGTFALGHTRLGIIDLSTNANQPFYSKDHRYALVFNGEIYNFQKLRNELTTRHGLEFKTHSDTEVIVEAFILWREQMVERLEGMFAIAIIDQVQSKLYLFRDRVGKKPLFYFQSDGVFAFASEIKSLLKHPVVKAKATLDKDIIPTFLHLGYIPEPATIYSTVFKFPAGHIGEVSNKKLLIIRPYWKIQNNLSHDKLKSPAEAKTRLASLLDLAVKERLVSDVPLGSFLSGGTDSSLVTAIAVKNTISPLKTFSIGFKESKFDESKYASEVARHLGTDHTDYVLTEKDARDILETYVHHFDEPFADTSAIPTMLVSKLARQHVTVALTGDGGDELFQGYGAYAWAQRLSNRKISIYRDTLQILLKLSGSSRLQRIASLLERPKAGGVRSHIFSQEQYFFSQHEIRDKLLINSKDFKAFQYDDEPLFEDLGLGAGEKQALFDLQFYLKDDLLVKVDRASMFYALECRCPLLDHNVVEFAFSLDHSLKVRMGKTKWVLKELLRAYLPDALIDRPKWGFSVPLSRWLKNDLQYLRSEYLSEKTIADVNLFHVSYIKKLEAEFLAGKDYLYNRLWVLIVLHKWITEHQ